MKRRRRDGHRRDPCVLFRCLATPAVGEFVLDPGRRPRATTRASPCIDSRLSLAQTSHRAPESARAYIASCI